ncbi:MAG: hypothetical protein KJ976_10270, partial [Proteobacteria bacterium]|nr:hypothetical protein [Pseudomonadota bacterium]
YLFVIPAEAGIQFFQVLMDSRLRGSDSTFAFLRVHQNIYIIRCQISFQESVNMKKNLTLLHNTAI